MRFFPSAVLASVLVSLSACGGGDDDGLACSTEARVSVELTLIDDASSPVPNADVSYRVDSGDTKTLVCGSNGLCNLGFEVSGLFAVSAAKVGYSAASGSVTVTRDECHVRTERLTLTLKRAG